MMQGRDTAPASTARATRGRRCSCRGHVGDFYYQVQGNTLLRRSGGARGGARLHARDGHDRGSRDGGDGGGRRERRRQTLQLRHRSSSNAPCDNKTAHVAYILIANKDDQIGVTHNDGKYFAYIRVTDDDIKKGESANPVKTLRMRYDAWKKAGAKPFTSVPTDQPRATNQ